MRLHTCIMFFSGTWIIYCMTLLAQKYIWSPLSTSLHHLLSWFWVSDHIRVAIEIFPGRSSKRCRAAVETVEEMLRLEVSGCATGRHQIGRSTWEEISIIFLGSSGCNTKTHIYIYILMLFLRMEKIVLTRRLSRLAHVLLFNVRLKKTQEICFFWPAHCSTCFVIFNL